MSANVQRLPPQGAYHCDKCKQLVVFKVVRTVRIRGDANKVYAYLVCPKCEAKATQTRWRKRPKPTNYPLPTTNF